MSDGISRRRAANDQEQNLDDGLLDRRRFLAQLGAIGAIGASSFALGDTAAAMANGLARTAAPRAARPIYMLSLGDSIMWGQGLAESQRFRNIVQQWIRAHNADRRDVVQLNYAHSGASLGYFPFGTSGRSSRALRRLRARAGAKIDPTGERGIDAVDVGMEGDSINNPFDRGVAAAAAANERRPFPDPSPEERYGGEIPRANPILWRQMDMAVADLQRRNVRPEDIDFVLMDGGANDADFTLSILNNDWHADWVEFNVRGVVQDRMNGFLPWALKTFPNAKFVVTGYYAGVSDKTPLASLASMVALMRPAYGALGIALAVPTGIVGSLYLNDCIARGAAFERATSDALRGAVAKSSGRAIFVSPNFGPEHCYGAPQTLMFRFEERDPAAPGREAECRTLYGTKPPSGPFADPTPLELCRKAATFHPNPAGARRYADRITDVLPVLLQGLLARSTAVQSGGQP